MKGLPDHKTVALARIPCALFSEEDTPGQRQLKLNSYIGMVHWHRRHTYTYLKTYIEQDIVYGVCYLNLETRGEQEALVCPWYPPTCSP